LDNCIFWLDQSGNVRLVQGYTSKIISPPQIAYNISTYPTISDAIALGYVHEGHSFYIITFPTANNGRGVTWCYDISTDIWHQRSSYPNAPDSRWRGECYSFFDNLHLIGDYENGKIYELDHELFEDDGNTLIALRVGNQTSAEKNFFIHSFELEIESGVGVVTGQGSDPQVMLRVSKDGGHTWSNQKWASMGKIGEFSKRVRWNRLGMAKRWIPEIRITDPVDRTIISASLDVTIGTK
jgi:hypothetical protein